MSNAPKAKDPLELQAKSAHVIGPVETRIEHSTRLPGPFCATPAFPKQLPFRLATWRPREFGGNKARGHIAR